MQFMIRFRGLHWKRSRQHNVSLLKACFIINYNFHSIYYIKGDSSWFLKAIYNSNDTHRNNYVKVRVHLFPKSERPTMFYHSRSWGALLGFSKSD